MPEDTTPHGGEALHPLPDRARIPKTDAEAGRPPLPEASADLADPAQRPPLPEHPEAMAADIEDEEADPVVDTGPGIAEDTGRPSVVRQPA